MVLKKYKPRIVGVTGSVGKTSAKDAIALVLDLKYKVWKSQKSYNSDTGVPLAILGEKSAWRNIFGWFKIIGSGASLILRRKNYPNYLVLEMGIDRPDDMKKLVSWVKPDISVVTAIGKTPVHVEFFKNSEALAEEKSKLVQVLNEEGLAVLNINDEEVANMRQKTDARVLTYGLRNGEEDGQNADVQASNYSLLENKCGKPIGASFKVEYQGNIVPVKVNGMFGRVSVLSILPAVAIGLEEGINLVKIAQVLGEVKQPPGRLSLIDGVNDTLILDSTYNASPLAVVASLEVLKELPGVRKIAVLGDMLELGKYTAEEHRKIGALVRQFASIIVTVGDRAKLIAEEAKRVKFGAKNIYAYQTTQEAMEALPEIIQRGDLILIKGSQGMRMERITESLMAKPKDAEKLLCRQEREWKGR